MSKGKPSATGLVYFMRRADGVGPIKIGCSAWPERRLSALQIWSPHPLEIVASCQGAFADERRLHRQFADCRLHGEWFEATPELLATIARVASTDCLPPAPADDRTSIVAARLASGETYSDIAADFGVTRQRIEQIARRAGCPRRAKGGRKKAPVWTQVEKLRVLAAQGLSRKQIAAAIGDEKQNVANAARHYGIEIKRSKKGHDPATVAKAFAIAADYKAGIKTADLAAKHGVVSQPNIYRFLVIAGVKPARTRRKQLPAADIVSAYLAGDTLQTLARRHDVCTGTVRRLIEQHGKLRSKSESEAIRVAAVRLANARRAA
jgi:transposase-like protein